MSPPPSHSYLEEKVSGVVERVTFHSQETGWSVLKVAPFNDPKLITVLIHQAQVFAGASMEFRGQWTHHPKFGEQFKATNCLEKKPASTAALEKYLGSGLIKGVGPKTAQKIVKFFGARTLEVFEGSITELLDVPSIAEKKLQQIQSSWEEHRSIRDVMIFLQSHGISTLFAVKIFKAYGQTAIQKVSDDPYCLARDIYGIGFFSADRIALSLGFQKDGENRIRAGIKHTLANSREEGHCYLVKEQIVERTLQLLELTDASLILNSLNQLHTEQEVLMRQLPREVASLNEELNPSRLVEAYYSKSLYYDEETVANQVLQWTEKQLPSQRARAESWMQKYCKKFEIQLSDEQFSSVLHIIETPFSILTGGPGCGKTTTTKVLVHLLRAMGRRIILAAPTGRAAQRMSEVIGQEAKTLHRLLEWEPQHASFKHNEDNPLSADFLIVDECSMLDIPLAASLFKAIPAECQILFIGDPDQLPSVGAGAVLQDLLASPRVPHFKLTQIFRQAQESLIIKTAHQINAGKFPNLASPMASPDIWKQPIDCLFLDSDEANQEQLQFISRAKKALAEHTPLSNKNMNFSAEAPSEHESKPNSELETEIDLLSREALREQIRTPQFEVPEKFKHVDLQALSQTVTGAEELKTVLKQLHPLSSLHLGYTALESIRRLYTHSLPQKLGTSCEIQILSPQVRGSLGTISLNKTIQMAVNPQRPGSPQIQMGEKFFRINDRVIQTRNNYDLNVFNGDIGVITRVDVEDLSAEVHFSDQKKTVHYSKEDLRELNLAYAITIHKSQGSEFEAVIIPVTTQHYKMLFRNLIYTGLTRAKKLAIFVGSRKALAFAIRSLDNRQRQTGLKYLLQ